MEEKNSVITYMCIGNGYQINPDKIKIAKEYKDGTATVVMESENTYDVLKTYWMALFYELQTSGRYNYDETNKVFVRRESVNA